MKDIEDIIKRESANNVYVFDKPTSPIILSNILLKTSGVWNYVGLREPGLWVLLSMPSQQCYINKKSYNFVEITRIECDEKLRGSGVFLKFIKRLLIACISLQRCLVIGCVESERMLTLMQRHKNCWQKLTSDPTSYAFIKI